MGGYIRIDKDLEGDPRVEKLANALARSHLGLAGEPENFTPHQLQILGLARDAVLGGLYRLWRYGDTYLGRHDRVKGASQGLAQIQGVTALPISLLKAFPLEWLRVHEDGTIELPGYAAKNALINRDLRREKGRVRTQRYRERKRKQQENGDASHDVTGEASHRHKSVTTGTGTGTGTGTEPSVTGSGTGTRALGSLANGADAPRSPSEEGKPKLGAAELESMARRLAAKGRDVAAVQTVLEPYGATPEQIQYWLKSDGVTPLHALQEAD